jgi:hypothetical protein
MTRKRPSIVRPARSGRLALALLALCALAAGALPFDGREAPGGAAHAQGDESQALRTEYEMLERESLGGHPNRRLSYIMLKPYLPPGTRMTSGYREPQKQLDLIVRFARNFNIPVPANVSVEDESSWQGIWQAVRARGIIIASPTTTPHGREEAVFDLSGADLDAINQGLLRAKDKGLITYRNIIIERKNNCVHVEVGLIDTKLLNNLTGLPSAPREQQGSAPPDDASQKAGLLQQMRRMHDAEPDPAKRIDYDNTMIAMLDPAADSARIGQLEAEIEAHGKEAERVGVSGEQREAVGRISDALRDDRLRDAEREAALLVKKFPDFPDARSMLVEIRTRRLVLEATRSMDVAGCGDCERADALADAALKLSPDHEGARLIKEDVASCVERCKNRRFALWGVSLLLAASLGGGLYFLALSRNWLPARAGEPRGWVLEVVDEDGRGRVFEVEKESLVIGSKGPPEGEADVVVNDPRRRVSRRHCTLLREGGKLYVRDESTNGTKVNGHEAAKGVLTQCSPGDSITLGDAALVMLRRG